MSRPLGTSRKTTARSKRREPDGKAQAQPRDLVEQIACEQLDAWRREFRSAIVQDLYALVCQLQAVVDAQEVALIALTARLRADPAAVRETFNAAAAHLERAWAEQGFSDEAVRMRRLATATLGGKLELAAHCRPGEPVQ